MYSECHVYTHAGTLFYTRFEGVTPKTMQISQIYFIFLRVLHTPESCFKIITLNNISKTINYSSISWVNFFLKNNSINFYKSTGFFFCVLYKILLFLIFQIFYSYKKYNISRKVLKQGGDGNKNWFYPVS